MSNKESIHLRQRKLSTGNISLYLDVYRNGVRQYEYLKLYLIPEKTRADKETNKQTLQLAETIKAKRIVELHNGEYGFTISRHNTRFFEFFASLIYNNENGIARHSSNVSGYKSTYEYLRQYEKRDITFANIDSAWVQGFKGYLDKAKRLTKRGDELSHNSKWLYMSKLRAVINVALERKLLSSDPFVGVRNFSYEDGEREFLTIDEVRLLVQTPCEYDSIRRAFIFSCLTGLRISDVRRLKWGDVQQQGAFTRVVFKQKKTKGQEYLDINAQAAEMMGERLSNDKHVFDGIPVNQATVNEVIKRWVLRAGIQKNITFHCSRHTFAIMMLDIGTDIYTVSKLLGHRELATTQIYARVLDKNKQKAVQNIPSIFE